MLAPFALFTDQGKVNRKGNQDMCMLSFVPAGVQPDDVELWNGGLSNPDGHGWAIVNDRRGTITIRRSMDLDEAINSFAEERLVNDSGPALFHSRIATSGVVDITGVHPFHVGRDRRTVLAHNGILFSPPHSSELSDTAIFASSMLPFYGSLDSQQTIYRLENYAGAYNKLVILSVDPSLKKRAYIINEEAGHWSSKSGVWHSTWDYIPYTPYTGKLLTAGSLWDLEGDDYPKNTGKYSVWPCDLCGSFNSVDNATQVCEMCLTCNDCHQSAEFSCQCYTPQSDSNTKKALEIYNGQLREMAKDVPFKSPV